MNDQAPLALPPPAGTAHWHENVLFGKQVSDELAGLNASFLMLATELHAGRPGMPVLGLPAHVVAQLARTGPQLPALPLPYALYDLRFRDERFWRGTSAAAVAVNDLQPAQGTDPRVLRFARVATTFAWHVAQSDARIARLALGMGQATLEVVGALPVGALEAVARRVAPSIAARFCTRERFWQLLAAALRFRPDDTGLERLKLLGLQLQGAEAARAQQLHRRLRGSAQE